MEKLSVCLIVKNEERVLDRCLLCAEKFADEIIVVDTGSTDKTVEIAQKHTPFVYFHPWEESFSKARNQSYSYATGDYIMWLDADDVIDDENIEKFKLLKASETDADVIFTTYSGYSETGLTDYILRDRIIRRAVFTGWLHDIHEAIPMEPGWRKSFRTDIRIVHKKEHVNEPERNMRIFDGLIAKGKTLTLFEKENLVKELALHDQTDEALKLFREIQGEATGSGYAYAFSFLVEALLRAERWQECCDALSGAESKIPMTPALTYAKGRAMEGFGDFERAAGLYREAMTIREDPYTFTIRSTGYNDYYPYLRLAAMAERRGDFHEALRLLDIAGKAYPKATEWQEMRFRIALGIQEPEKSGGKYHLEENKKENKEMAKTEKELQELKEEVKNMREKLLELSDDELAQVVGGGVTKTDEQGKDFKMFNLTEENITFFFIETGEDSLPWQAAPIGFNCTETIKFGADQ